MAGEETAIEAVKEVVVPVLGTLSYDIVGILILGAVGGMVFALLMERGIIPPYRDTTLDGKLKYNFGFIADIIVGSIAALVTYAINPPGTMYQFIAIGITSGIGGKAILSGYINGLEVEKRKGRLAKFALEYRSAVEQHYGSKTPLSAELDVLDKKYIEL